MTRDANAASQPIPTVPALLAEIDAALSKLQELERHRPEIGEEAVRGVLKVVVGCRARLARSELFVCVVGEQKVGKSTFLNAILGVPLLGVAVRECTGTITFLRHGPRPQYRAVFSSGAIEEFSAVFPDRHDEFAAQACETDREIAVCARLATALPSHIKATEAAIGEVELKLQQLKRTVTQHATAETAASEALALAGHAIGSDAEGVKHEDNTPLL